MWVGSGRSTGLQRNAEQGNYNDYKSEAAGDAGTMKGIVFDRNRVGDAPNEWDGQFAIAALESAGVEVSYRLLSKPREMERRRGSRSRKTGGSPMTVSPWVSDRRSWQAHRSAFHVEAGEKRVIPMVLAWDFPVVQFGEGRKWNRRYTDFYGTSGKHAWEIARDGPAAFRGVERCD